MMKNIKLEILPDLNEMAQIIKKIETIMLDNNFTNEDISNISLCLAEILTNIISYAGLSSKDKIRIFIEIDDNGIIFKIEDDGIKKPEGIEVSMPKDPLSVHGRGQFLTKILSDEFIYERKNKKNITILKKNRTKNN